VEEAKVGEEEAIEDAMRLVRSRTDPSSDQMTEVNTRMNRSSLSREDWLLAADLDAGFGGDILASDEPEFWWLEKDENSKSMLRTEDVAAMMSSGESGSCEPLCKDSAAGAGARKEAMGLRRRSSTNSQVAFNPRVRVVVYQRPAEESAVGSPMKKLPTFRKASEHMTDVASGVKK